jgi:hypothetical protein
MLFHRVGLIFFILSAVQATRIHRLRPNFPLRAGELWCDERYPYDSSSVCMEVHYDASQAFCQVTFGPLKERFFAAQVSNSTECNLLFKAHWDKRWFYTFCIGDVTCLHYTRSSSSIGSALVRFYPPRTWYEGFWINVYDTDGTSLVKSIKL